MSPFRRGSRPQPNRWSFWPTYVLHSSNDISIGSDVFAQFMIMSNRHTQTDIQTLRPRSIVDNFFALRACDAANWNRPMWHFRDFMQNFKRQWTRIQWSDVTIICSLHNSTAVDENDKIPPKQHWDIRNTLAESSNSSFTYLKSAQSNAQFTPPDPTRQNYRVSSRRRCDWILKTPNCRRQKIWSLNI